MLFFHCSKINQSKSSSENPLDGKAILIDEIDLHLHPSWQVKIVKALKTTFPNVQFIVTTHSPLVLSSVKRGEIIALSNGGVSPYDKIPNKEGGCKRNIRKSLLYLFRMKM
ncbi:MAG: AAA family ATPase [Saprospiraceae bacterium]|nr:AAA family ATPase [Saprospiraceae bacterium]